MEKKYSAAGGTASKSLPIWMTDEWEGRLDLHMHTTISDGTDSPEQLLQKVRSSGIAVFSVTDHDAVKGCAAIRSLLREGDPIFLNGVEFSCRDEKGKYHILGYNYDLEGEMIQKIVGHTHSLRMYKVKGRLEFLEREFGFVFPEEEKRRLLSLDNPGKPHIGNLLTECGYAPDKDTAITRYVNRARVPGQTMVRPETAIEAILGSGGIPVLAHPYFGDGSQLLDREELGRRTCALMEYGLQGLECYYPGFSAEMQRELLELAGSYDLYVTAGSDYHGANKKVALGEHPLSCIGEADPRLREFLHRCHAGKN